MKRRVENRRLRQIRAENFARGDDSGDVRGIVQRREFDAVFDAAQDLRGDEH